MSYDGVSKLMERHRLSEPVSARMRNAMRRLGSFFQSDGDLGPAIDAANVLARIEQDKLKAKR